MNRLKEWIKGHRTVLLGLGSTFLMIVVIVVLADWVVLPLYTHQGEEVELSDVTERSFTEAEEILRSQGFRIIKEGEKYDATYPESTVVFQNPAPYSRVKRGRRIYVTLSAGERMVEVPRVIGMSERDAEFLLKQTGLELGEVFYEYVGYPPSGVVYNQSILAGTEVVEHSTVDITVSRGRMPDRFLVPDVVGKSLEIARRLLMQSGLTVGYVTYESRKDLVPDTVLEQSVMPGEEVEQGRSINLVVSMLEESAWDE